MVLLVTGIARPGLAADPVASPVAVPGAVASSVQQGEWTEVLVLLQGPAGGAVQREAEARPLAQLDRAAYIDRMAERRERFGRLKAGLVTEVAAIDELEVLRDYPVLPVLNLRVRTPERLQALAADPRVASIDEIVRVRPVLDQSLPLIEQPAAAASGHTGLGTSICVLDTGLDYTRAAFGDCSEGPDGQPSGGDCAVVHVEDFAEEDGVLDDNGHGTNVSGVALGVAPEAGIIGLDVFAADGFGYTDDIIAAMEWCIANRAHHGIAALNMSLGADSNEPDPVPADDAWGTAITGAVDAGIAVVAASGNDGHTAGLSRPAAYEGVISVGAVYDSDVGGISWQDCTDPTTHADQVACFSNSDDHLDLLAPGARITAAGITQGGTSQASPHVAGAAAVLRQVFPDDTVAETEARMESTGVAVLDGRNGLVKPRLDLDAAGAGAPVLERLDVSTAGAGQVVGSAGGILCGENCVASYASGTAVTLEATAHEGAEFQGWNGACAGAGPSCALAMDADRATEAVFSDADFGAAFPAGDGWSDPPGSDAAWFATSDTRYSGSHSLRAGVIDHGQVSRLVFSGDFKAGYLTFARRVSSEPGYDHLDFYIDGSRKGRWSGEIGWGLESYAVGAGSHTLMWEYAKDGDTDEGHDTAWIDDVALPPLQVPGTLQFTRSEALVAEDGTEVVLEVSREGGADGAASVLYATRDGTATGGDDFTASAGNLSWSDGDPTSRPITVPVLDNGSGDGQREFGVVLSDASGASLGTPFEVVVTIADDEPSSCGHPDIDIIEGSVSGPFQSTACSRIVTGQAGFGVTGAAAAASLTAGESVSLGPGFRVEEGATLSVTIDPALAP